VSDGINLLVGTGIAGGLSTFSSFAYGTVVLMSGSAASLVVASAYVLISLFLGYIARSLWPTGGGTIVPLSRIRITGLQVRALPGAKQVPELIEGQFKG
jgi:hypothetical protein